MRYLAAILLLTAAVDWPTLLLDRVGYAAAGVACLALALPPRPRRIRRAAMPAVPPRIVELDDELDDQVDAAFGRVGRFTSEGFVA